MNDNIGTHTNRVTQPLVLRILASFAVITSLFFVLAFAVILTVNGLKTASQQALYNQSVFNINQSLKENLVLERASLLSTLYTQTADSMLATYQETFERGIGELLNNPITREPATYKLLTAHIDLKSLEYQVVQAASAGQIAQARELWLQTDLSLQNLLKTIDERLITNYSVTQESIKQAKNTQNGSITTIMLITFVCALIISGVIYAVFRWVIAPLRLLNENLTKLLWTQTEHLTDRLNLLQADINVNNEMLTTVRHDLKAPLGTIKGLAELSTILQPDLSGDVKENLVKIVEMADHSVGTISNILMRREQKLELETVVVGELVSKVLQLVDLRQYNVQEQIEADDWVLDRALMEHALLNLVSNARKFSVSGIKVGVRKIHKAGTLSVNELELWVWNDGATISAEDRVEIFKPGKQTDEGKKAGGHGLGLSIVKSIAERHHGRVVVESHEKIGTTFRIFIPEISFSPKISIVEPTTISETILHHN